MDEHDEAARIIGRSLSTLVALSIVTIAVVGVLGALGPTQFWPWLASWLVPWAQTSGFAGAAASVGGLAAVIGAVIAYRGARRQADVARAAADKAETWRRVQWAFDLLLEGDPDASVVAWLTLASIVEDEAHTDAADKSLVQSVLEVSGFQLSDYLDEHPGDGTGASA
ncbi:hypothetical protein BKD30_01815 [Tersicoccus phoenicis]|uniref:Uncharacterized protein n=1 Tax=Tersicoccus phoenicis TaxID=554083 RepID=A0A1R1LL53_9MICC|nr:hypothetical protein [Tersicoccus phoenicis]OMH28278.1 hypothetical protein BKD30_01815 [Tersicoccus phoenicis]